MKKILSILVLAIVAVQFAFAGDVITKDVKELPLTARNFINQYFSKPQISYIKANFPNEIITKIERKSTGIEVELANDFSLKFNKKGQFVSLDD